MPKKDFAQELKEEFKKGNLKPSQLKRSQSTEEIPNPNLTVPVLQKSKSAETLPLQPRLSEQVKQLKQDLVFSQNTAQNYLQRLQQLEPELDNLKAELKTLQATNTQLIDKNNELRLQALKDFGEVRANQQGIEQAVNKLVSTEQTQINYQVQNGLLLREKKDLEKRLQTAEQRIQKLYQLKGLPHTTTNSPWPFKTLFWTSLLTFSAIYLLSRENYDPRTKS